MKTIGYAIAQFIRGQGFERKLKEAEILSNWEKIVGKHIARKSHPEKIIDGNLILKVSDSTWRSEISYLSPQIKRNINELVKMELVKEIILR
jgi:predicted nucleic acid-binding Zn ribbon protein